MPMNRKLYPSDWEQIAAEVKNSANWKCEECDRPCRRPGQSWMDFVGDLLTNNKLDWYMQTTDGGKERPQRFTLTVAHMDHNPSNCDRSNLKAMCSGCHLRYDAGHHAQNAMRTRARKKVCPGQGSLFMETRNV